VSALIPQLRAMAGRCIRAMPPRLQCVLVAARAVGHVRRGPKSFVHRSVQVLGKRAVSIGANTVLSQDCWLNVNHRNVGQISIRIGDNCFIGRRNFFSSGRAIELADFVLTANDCHFLGSTHVADDPMVPIISTGTTSTDVIRIGANTFVGAGARIVGNVSVGHGCIVGAGSIVTKDVPPFSQVAGSPAIVRKRFSVARAAWVPVDAFTAEDERALPAEADYLVRLSRHAAIAMPYIAAGSDLGDC